MSREFLPRQDVQIADPTGRATTPYYVWFQSLDRILDGGVSLDDFSDKLAQLQALIDNIPTTGFLPVSTQVIGQLSISSTGALANGVVILQLEGDQQTPDPTSYYGTSPAGVKSFHPVSDTVEAEADELTKGVAVDGVTTFGLADVTPTAGGTLQKYGFDAKGRRSQEDAATTDDLAEGLVNLYFPEAPMDGDQYARRDGAWSVVSSSGGQNVDGGNASSVYTPSQVIDGGSASG